jgi:predicted porin
MLGGNFDTANTDTMTNMGIRYTYSLSKRTSLFAGYSYSQNQTGIKGITVNQLGGGIQHLF